MSQKKYKGYSMKQKIYTPLKRIGNILPSKRLTLLTGLPGSGKTTTLLKFLNSININDAYWFNLDEDVDLQNKGKYFSANANMLKPLLNNQIVDLKDKVVVIDHYQRLMAYLGKEENTEKDQRWITNKLEKVCKKSKCTLIIIGHPEDYVGKDSIFKANQSLVRNCAEHIHIDIILPRGKTISDIHYRTFVKKNRGNTVPNNGVIENWMRDDPET